MKKRCVVTFVVAFIALILGSTIFIIAQDRSIRAIEERRGLNATGEEGLGDEILDDGNLDDSSASGGGGGDSSGGGGGSSASEAAIDEEMVCVMQTIKYSLKNFQEDIKCLDNSEGKCILLNAICSVDVYNIDVDAEGNFTIDYALVDSRGQDIESQLIDMYVDPTKFVKFKANMTIKDPDGIDMGSSCTPRITSVPKKEVCN